MTKQQNNEWGDIPQGWEVKRIGEVLTIKHGKSQKDVESDNGIYPILATGGQIGWANQFLYDKPSVLIGRKGTINKPSYQATPFWTVDTLFYSEIHSDNLPKFIFYKFCLIDWLKNNEASGVPSQTAKAIENIEITIPKSLAEQTAIATVLSDTDKWIDSLTSLITKKQAIKSATMSQLLSGQKRLPQFANHLDGTPKTYVQTDNGKIPEDWEVVALGDLLAYEQPTKYIIQDTELYENANIPVLTAGKTFVLGYTAEDSNIYEKYPVIIFDDFTTDSKFVNFKFKVKSSAMKLLKPRNEKTPIYLIFCLLQNIDFVVGDHKRHWISEFRHLKVSIPKSPTEQTDIAQILSDMDSDIIALEHRLTKARALKQGLMHQLLTGKIRLG